MAYLHREEALPQRRHRLYQKVLERMAEHWDANKGLPPRPSAERFELEDKLAFLRALAWKMPCHALVSAARRVESGNTFRNTASIPAWSLIAAHVGYFRMCSTFHSLPVWCSSQRSSRILPVRFNSSDMPDAVLINFERLSVSRKST